MAASMLKLYKHLVSKKIFKVFDSSSRNLIAAHCGAHSQTRSEMHDETSSSSSDEEMKHGDDHFKEDYLKAEILEASLPYVNSLGWSKEAIAKGAESLGYPGVAHGLFTKGEADLVNYFQVYCNENLEGHLHDTYGGSGQKSQTSSQEIIRDGIETRLHMIIPYLDKWTQAMSIMMHPSNSPTHFKNQIDLANTIFFYAKDKSVNMDWYAKRFALLTAYSATELSLVQDKSPNFAATWEFLDRRLKQMHTFFNTIDQAQNSQKMAKDVFIGGLVTVRNMLGLR